MKRSLLLLTLVSVRARAQSTDPPGLRLDAVKVSGSATSMSVVTIPVPAVFLAGTRVTYVVSPGFEGAVLGRLAGDLTVSDGAPPPILFAVRAPRYAAAGELEVARVRFSSATTTVEVPVVALVETVRNIAVTPGARPAFGQPAQPVPVGYRLLNHGNAPDTVTVEAMLPAGWRTSGRSEPIVLAARASADGSVNVIPPPNANGTTSLRLIVKSHGAVVGESLVDVLVAGTGSPAGNRGPVLTMGVAAASGPWDGLRSLESFELRGPLTDGLTVAARFSSTSGDDDASYAFSRANVAPAPFSLQLSSAAWKVDAGVMGASLSTLTGVNLVGRGASALARAGNWTVAAIAASPDVGLSDTRGSLAGARFEVAPISDFTISTSLATLRESRGSSNRSLDAISLAGGRSGFLGGRLGAEIANRRFDGTSSLGWAADYSRRSPDENIDFRYVHAPGGSQAFARAASELTASGSRKVSSRFNVTGSAWRTADDGVASLSRMSMDGWTVGGHYALSADVHMSLAGRSSTLDAATRIGEFGSGEHGADASLDMRRGPISAQMTVSAARLLRRTAATGDAVHHQAASRGALRGSIGSAFHGTSIVFTGNYERTGSGVGAAPEQWSYGMQLGTTVAPPLGDALRLEASAERLGGALGAVNALMFRGGAEWTVFRRTVVLFSVERNPWVLPTAGANPWMYVMGVSRSTNLPGFSSRGTRGRVFKDLNGNGRADHGEPGFSGVVLRRRGAVAVSDRSGTFTLDGDPREPYEVDTRSFPIGWLTGSSTVPGGTREIAAVSVASLRVDLVRDVADTARVARSDLGRVVIMARDDAGREWMSRRASDTTAVFDALPPGRYTIGVDASAVAEPLRAVVEPGSISITNWTHPPPVRIILRTRQLRFSNQRRGGSGQ